MERPLVTCLPEEVQIMLRRYLLIAARNDAVFASLFNFVFSQTVSTNARVVIYVFSRHIFDRIVDHHCPMFISSFNYNSYWSLLCLTPNDYVKSNCCLSLHLKTHSIFCSCFPGLEFGFWMFIKAHSLYKVMQNQMNYSGRFTKHILQQV